MSDQPEEKLTVEIPAVPDWAVKLTEKVVGGFQTVNVRLDGLEGTDKTLANEVQRMSIAVDDLRAADRRHEDDLRRLSDRAKAPSSADLSNEALIASEIVARKELAEKVDALAAGHAQLNEKQDAQTQILVAISENAAKFVASPRVKIAGGILFGIVAKWLADHYGIHLPQ